MFLVVYVDDFKLSGPTANVAKGWSLIRSGIRTEEPTELGLYLGCKHEQSEKVLPDSGIRVRVMEYNMEDFLRSCVERYKELTGVTYLRSASRPFLSEPMALDFSDGYAIEKSQRGPHEKSSALFNMPPIFNQMPLRL